MKREATTSGLEGKNGRLDPWAVKRAIGRGGRRGRWRLGAFALALSILAFASHAFAYGPYDVTVIRVIDGDTVEVDAAVWPGQTNRIKVRVADVNTPEIRRSPQCEKALGAKAPTFTQAWLDGGQVSLTGVKLGKYAGRVVGNLVRDGASLSQALIESGHGRPYSGGKKGTWC